jgi:hypothetical protein
MALVFDGVNDSVDFGDIADVDGSPATLTISLWYKPAADSQFGILWGKVASLGGDSNDLYLAHSDGSGGAGTGIQWTHGTTSPKAIVASGVFTAGTWYHIGLIYDGSQNPTNINALKIYIDGVQKTLAFTGAIPTNIVGTADTVRCGTDGANAGDLNGTLAHLRCWDAVLTAAQLEQERWSFLPSRTANLFLWAPMDDGTNAKDYSQSGNNGTVAGALQAAGPPVSYGGPMVLPA